MRQKLRIAVIKKTMSNRFIVIMAGGRGERFWPQSRLKKPKHLLPIVGDKPMLVQALDRLGNLVPKENILIITNIEQRDAVLEVCPQLTADQVIGEPIGRDTAAAVGLATVIIQNKCENGVYAILPADHVIEDSYGFQKILDTAFQAAEQENGLVTVGIKPTYPATGYGYIHKDSVQCEINSQKVYAVKRFVEKPNLDTAQSYLDSGEYYWNAGMFIWKTSTIADELKTHTPVLWDALLKISDGIKNGGSLDQILEKNYSGLEKISIDFAVMEKAKKVLVIESAFDWDDVGEWPAVARHFPADENGNVQKGTVLINEGSGNIVINQDGHLTALIGVDDLIVVQTPDATLICPKNRAQEIKKVVKQITNSDDLKHLI